MLPGRASHPCRWVSPAPQIGGLIYLNFKINCAGRRIDKRTAPVRVSRMRIIGCALFLLMACSEKPVAKKAIEPWGHDSTIAPAPATAPVANTQAPAAVAPIKVDKAKGAD